MINEVSPVIKTIFDAIFKGKLNNISISSTEVGNDIKNNIDTLSASLNNLNDIFKRHPELEKQINLKLAGRM